MSTYQKVPHCAIKSFCDSTPWGVDNSLAVHPPRLPHAARPPCRWGGFLTHTRSVQVETLGLGICVRALARVCVISPLELGGGWLGRRCRDAGVRVSDGPSSSGRVAGRGREDVGGGANLTGGCGRVSGSPLSAGAEPHRSAARLSGQSGKRCIIWRGLRHWGLLPGVRAVSTGGTTHTCHTNPSSACLVPGYVRALRAGTVPRLALGSSISAVLTNTR